MTSAQWRRQNFWAAHLMVVNWSVTFDCTGGSLEKEVGVSTMCVFVVYLLSVRFWRRQTPRFID